MHPSKINNKRIQEYFKGMYQVKQLRYNTLYTYYEALKWYFEVIIGKDCKKVNIGRLE